MSDELSRGPVERLVRCQHRTVTSKAVRTAPERIWLQVSDETYDHQSEFPSDHDGITWCDDSVLSCEVEYVRADIALAALPPDWRNEAWELGRTLDKVISHSMNRFVEVTIWFDVERNNRVSQVTIQATVDRSMPLLPQVGVEAMEWIARQATNYHHAYTLKAVTNVIACIDGYWRANLTEWPEEHSKVLEQRNSLLEMLKEARNALNQVPNRSINGTHYKTTYELLSHIDAVVMEAGRE